MAIQEGMYGVDISGVDKLAEAMDEYEGNCGTIISNYLYKEAYEKITTHIPGLIHPSGRKWRGKHTSATVAVRDSVFTRITSGLTLTVSSKKNYHYLYFPDDGSNTIHHAGNQQFMRRGAEESTDEIVDELVDRLTAAFTV